MLKVIIKKNFWIFSFFYRLIVYLEKIFEDEDKENHKAEASEFHVALPSAVTNASFNNDISNILATTPLSYRMDMHENDIHPNEMFVSLPGVITHENTWFLMDSSRFWFPSS